MYPASSEGLNKETGDAVYFFTPAFDALNNFSAHTVEVWGNRFHTAEHAFQWRKYSDVRPDLAEKILAAGCPEEAQCIARQNKPAQPKDWHERKVGVMEEILRAKLVQYEDVREVLKRTSKRKIVENSPADDFWGCGPNGDGKNMMGELWMKIRDGA